MKSLSYSGLLALSLVCSAAAANSDIAAPAPPPAKSPSRTFAVVALGNPRAVAVDRAGNLYVGDVDSGTVQKITLAGAVTTLVSSNSSIKDPIGLAVGRDGAVYVADADDNTVLKVASDGGVAPLGKPAAGSSAASFSTPTSVAVDATGDAFVTNNGDNTILKITPGGAASVFAGKAGASGGQDGAGDVARFATPRGIAIDQAGNLYVADEGNSNIRKITPAGVVSTLAGSTGQSGNADGTGPAARFAVPRALTVDAAGNVYVADTDNNTIRKITPAGVVTTLAGRAGETGATNGTGGAARFSEPRGIAVDTAGNIYVADSGNQAIRQITPDGVVTTVAGAKP
jgi:sugar lactone lactonase YvrE